MKKRKPGPKLRKLIEQVERIYADPDRAAEESREAERIGELRAAKELRALARWARRNRKQRTYGECDGMEMVAAEAARRAKALREGR